MTVKVQYSFRQSLLLATLLCVVNTSLHAKEIFTTPLPDNPTSITNGSEKISHAFEMRFVSSDPKADGVTDWRKDRVEYLRHYADYAKKFFNDPDLDTLTTTEEEVVAALKKLKPQPLPKVRQRILLNDWQWY